MKDNIKPVPTGCTCCGYSNVPAKIQESTDARGNTITRIKWICPRCAQVSRKETIEN